MSALKTPLKICWRSLVTWWDDWVNLAVISLVGLVCTITIVLAPPAIFAMFAASNELVRGASPNVRGFLENVKRYFLPAWGWALVLIFIGSVLYANLLFYATLQQSWTFWLQFFLLFVWLTWMASQLYALPYYIIQEKQSILLAWRNGIFTLLASPFYTLVITLVALIWLAVCIGLILPLLLGGAFFIAILGCTSIQERVETFQKITTSRGKNG